MASVTAGSSRMLGVPVLRASPNSRESFLLRDNLIERRFTSSLPRTCCARLTSSDEKLTLTSKSALAAGSLGLAATFALSAPAGAGELPFWPENGVAGTGGQEEVRLQDVDRLASLGLEDLGLEASSAPALFDLAVLEERSVQPDNSRQGLENLSMSLLFGTMLGYWVSGIFNLDDKFQNVATWGTYLCNAALAWLLVDRWIISGHFPVSNMYESLMFLAWCMTAVTIAVERGTGAREVGRFTSPLSLLIAAGASLTLPPSLQTAGALVPALRSNWLVMHVSVMILSYAALLTGSTIALAYLFFSYTTPEETNGSATSAQATFTRSSRRQVVDVDGQRVGIEPSLAQSLSSTNGAALGSQPRGEVSYNGSASVPAVALLERQVEDGASSAPMWASVQMDGRLSKLDNLSYRSIGIGFPLLTIGILSGAVWANEAWGAVWSWDPKETWALITWLVYAVYLHTRLIKGWEGRSSAWVASVGFLMVWLCYLGVNLLGSGLHSYGWLSQ